MPRRKKSLRFVSRGGDKLDGALSVFELSLAGVVATDLGASVGGFTDCMLQRGAARVYAVDTAYGILDWRLRQDDRVQVLERTNALHVELPEPVDIVAADVGWTPMHLILPTAIRLLKPGGTVVALLKPQYEAEPVELDRGIVVPDRVLEVVTRVVSGLLSDGFVVAQKVASTVPGSGGNQEWFILVQRA
jgi:23S rRNA (cytidine1920-2'-O)/16S rRNA (cytidine1409-2'-O)-methyltransferase